MSTGLPQRRIDTASKQTWLGCSCANTGTSEKGAELVRGTVHFETGEDGTAFFTSSVTFCGVLPRNGFDDHVPMLPSNVVTRFAGLEATA